MIEQIFAILIAFQAILAIIEALKSIASRSVCAKGSSKHGDDGQCCDNEFCPPFLGDNADGYVNGVSGRLTYFRQCSEMISVTASVVSRPESWQFSDMDQTIPYQFKDIITPINDFIYWPQPLEFDTTTSIRRAPYLLDVTLETDPTYFGHSDPIGGIRPFQIKNVIVGKIPYIGTYDHENNLISSPDSGTFSLVGGKVYEEDGTTPFMISGNQATLQTFIHESAELASNPPDDGYVISNASYSWRFNYEALIDYRLITMMCMPSLGEESAALNATLDIPSIQDIPLPDAGAAAACMAAALAELRKNVSVENVAKFSAAVTGCINKLKNDTETCYNDMFVAGTNRFHSTVTLDPDIQFVGSPITITAVLKDGGGTVLSTSIPAVVQSEISSNLKGHVTLGTISEFTYDGYESFNAQISSTQPGSGELTVTFNEAYFATVLNRDNDNAQTSIEITTLPYQFIGKGFAHGIGTGDEGARQRRDPGDVARDGD